MKRRAARPVATKQHRKDHPRRRREEGAVDTGTMETTREKWMPPVPAGKLSTRATLTTPPQDLQATKTDVTKPSKRPIASGSNSSVGKGRIRASGQWHRQKKRVGRRWPARRRRDGSDGSCGGGTNPTIIGPRCLRAYRRIHATPVAGLSEKAVNRPFASSCMFLSVLLW